MNPGGAFLESDTVSHPCQTRMVIMAFLTALTLHLLLFSFAPLISPLMIEMDISHAQAGAAFSACILAVLMFRIPWGFMIDRMGFARAMKVAMLFVSTFGVLRSFSLNYEMLVLSQFFLGVGFAAVLPGLSKLVSVWARGRAGSATGVYVAGFPAGEVAAFTLTTYMLSTFGSWRFSFMISGLWASLLFIVWLILGGEPSGGRPGAALEVKTSCEGKFVELIRLREVWVLAGLCVLSMGAYDTLLTWLPRILEFRGYQLETVGVLASALPLGFLVSSLSMGLVSDRVLSKRTLLVTLGIAGGLTTPIISLSSGVLLSLAIFSVGFCVTGILTLVLIVPVEIPKTEDRVGSAVGFISSVGNLGSLLFPMLLGYVIDISVSALLPVLVLSVIVGITAILSLRLQ